MNKKFIRILIAIVTLNTFHITVACAADPDAPTLRVIQAKARQYEDANQRIRACIRSHEADECPKCNDQSRDAKTMKQLWAELQTLKGRVRKESQGSAQMTINHPYDSDDWI